MKPAQKNKETAEDQLPIDFSISDAALDGEVVAPPHYHPHCEILYCMEGYACIGVDHRKTLLKAGHMQIIADNEIHSVWYRPGMRTRMLTVRFLPHVLRNDLAGQSGLRYVNAFLNAAHSPVHRLDPSDPQHALLVQELMNAYREFRQKPVAYELCIRARLLGIIGLALRCGFISLFNGNDDEVHKNLSACMRRIENNLASGVSMEDAAKQAGMSYCYFSRMFRRLTGRTFTEYLAFVRVREAERLMLTTDRSITEIARMVGYNDLYRFEKNYKKLNGCVPSAFRKASRPLAPKAEAAARALALSGETAEDAV